MVNNMPFNDVCTSIGFTLNSWSKLSLESDTMYNNHPVVLWHKLHSNRLPLTYTKNEVISPVIKDFFEKNIL